MTAVATFRRVQDNPALPTCAAEGVRARTGAVSGTCGRNLADACTGRDPGVLGDCY